jgi:hypothetical protein
MHKRDHLQGLGEDGEDNIKINHRKTDWDGVDFDLPQDNIQWWDLRGCIQKFPDSVDNEIYAYNNKHSLRSNTKSYGGKLTTLTHKIAIQLHLVAESCTIWSSRSRWPVRELSDTPS